MQTAAILLVQPIAGRNSAEHRTKQIPGNRKSGAGHAIRNEGCDGIGQAEPLARVYSPCAP